MLTYCKAVEELLREFPEIERTDAIHDLELPYPVFGTFALYLCDALRKEEDGNALLTRAARFFDRMAASDDPEVIDLLIVGVLEIVADDEACVERVRRVAGPEVVGLLERVGSGWKPSH